MDIVIKYCAACGFLERAEAIAAALRERGGANVTLEAGNRGVFNVMTPQRLVFCRHDEGRLPEVDEVLARLELA